MGLGKKNEVKVALENYVHLIIGERKVGKTTLVADIAREVYGNIEDLLLISIGNEDGYHAIDGVLHEDPQTWGDLVKIIDELVRNPDENDFKMIAFDTIDEFVALASKEVLRLHLKEKGEKCKSVNDAFGGYGRGRKRLLELIDDQLTRIKRAKYAPYLIGHSKKREIKQKLEGDPYTIVTSNLNADEFNAFAYKADIVCNIISERVVNDGMLESTNRYMCFRSDGYVDAGSRFAEMPERVLYGAKNYEQACKDGIKASLKKEVSDKQIAKMAEKNIAEKEKAAKEFVKTDIANSEEDSSREDLFKFIAERFKALSPEVKKEIQGIMKEHSIKKVSAPDASIEGLKAIKARIEQE